MMGRALLVFLIACTYSVQAQVYSPVNTGTVCSTTGKVCTQNVSYNSGLCIALSSISTNGAGVQTLYLNVTLPGNVAFGTSGTIFMYDGNVCGNILASANFAATATTRTISTPLTFGAGTMKTYYVTWVPSNTSVAKRVSNGFQVNASQCSMKSPLLSTPANGFVYPSGTTNGSLSWSANGNTTGTTYYVTVKNSAGIAIMNRVATTSTSLNVSGLLVGNSYTWFVSAEKSGCIYGVSNTNSFVIGAATGSLRVNLSPNPIGSGWQVNGGIFNTSGSTIILNPGTYTVSFATVTGYITPSSFTATITAGNTTVYSIAGYNMIVPTPCGTVRVFTPRKGSNNNARSTLVEWENELGRGISSYSIRFVDPVTNQSVSVNGANTNTVTVLNPNPATLSYSLNGSTYLQNNKEYQIIIRGFNGSNQEITNNVADNFRFTTVGPENIQRISAGCPLPIVQYGTALGHFKNTILYKNGYFVTGCNFDEFGGKYGNVPSIYQPNFNVISNQNSNQNTTINITNSVGYQCVEFTSRYMAVNYGIPFTGNGNAWEIFPKAFRGFLKSYSNGSTKTLPKIGDIICFDKNSTYIYGHIGVVGNVTANKVYLISQNMGTGASVSSIITKHFSTELSYTITNTGEVTVTSPTWSIIGWMRAEPKLTLSAGTTKTESGNSSFVSYNSKPIFTIERHQGSPTFKIDLARYNTATNCYDIAVPSITNITTPTGTADIIIPSTGTSQPFVPALPIGKYKARVTTCYGNCTNQGVPARPVYFEMTANANLIIPNTTTSMASITNTKMILSPNPVDNTVIVNIESETENEGTLSIFDISGRQFFVQKQEIEKGYSNWTIDTSLFGNGIYICKLQIGNDIKTEKLIVSHG